jgi:hypothetical protein
MTVSGILILLAVLAPALFALVAGRGFVWQLLAFMCTGAAFASLVMSFVGAAGSILLWLAAWVFAGVAANTHNREVLLEKIASSVDVDDEELKRSLRRSQRRGGA